MERKDGYSSFVRSRVVDAVVGHDPEVLYFFPPPSNAYLPTS